MHIGRGNLRGRMIGVTGDAIGIDLLCFGTVASNALRFVRHENIGGLAAPSRLVVTLFAVHTHMFRVVEIRLRHPTIDQNRFGEEWCSVRHVFDLMAVGAPYEVGSRSLVRALALRPIRARLEKHVVLKCETVTAKLRAQQLDLPRHEDLQIAVADSFSVRDDHVPRSGHEGR